MENYREGVKLASLFLSGKYSPVADVGNHGYDSRSSQRHRLAELDGLIHREATDCRKP